MKMYLKRQTCVMTAIVRAVELVSLLAVLSSAAAEAAAVSGEMALANVTRFASGDFFTVIGTDCGPTRCMEASHGTALAARVAGGAGAAGGAGDACVCQCRAELPTFREDHQLCVNQIEECQMAGFGRNPSLPQIPFVFLPLKGQIIYPSKEIVFTDVANAICAVTSAQYLSPSGRVTLRDVTDNDVPFGLYRDEGKTYLQWRGSTLLHARLEGRVVVAHVVCSAPPAHLATSCAAFRIAGAASNALLDVRSITFTAGEPVTSEPAPSGQGLSVLESLAIGVCILMLIFIYAAGIVFYVHYKKRTKKKEKDVENSNTISTDNESSLETRLDMENVTLKTNPLLKMDAFGADYLQDTLSDVSERTEENLDNQEKLMKKPHVIAAMVHSTRKSSTRLRERISSPTADSIRQRQRSQSSFTPGQRLRCTTSPEPFERAPQSHVAIVDCHGDMEIEDIDVEPPSSSAQRRKLYFNPVFFETEHLKNPPPAAVEFLVKIREVMTIAKEKMTSKRFIPVLTNILEEESYHTIDLGWDIPCGRRGRRFSAVSLKRENSRRSHRCTGCPGCDTSSLQDHRQVALTRSNSCNSCVSDDYKQNIVRKWLDEVPPPLQPSRPIKTIAKVSGTPRIKEPKTDTKINVEVRNEEVNIPKHTQKIEKKDIVVIKSQAMQQHTTRRVRKKLPPPPPPPGPPPPPPEEVKIPKEIKQKMQAVIKELNEYRRVEPMVLEDVHTESVKPIEPRILIPVRAAETYYHSDDNMLSSRRRSEIRYEYEMDSLERGVTRKRRFSLSGTTSNRRGSVDGTASMDELEPLRKINEARERLSKSCKDVRKVIQSISSFSDFEDSRESNFVQENEVFVNSLQFEPTYGNVPRPGALTIQVRGSPVREHRQIPDDFDPDTLDRKTNRLRASEKNISGEKKKIDKILLKSAGSFKCKAIDNVDVDDVVIAKDSTFTRKIGSLREIYEAKTKVHTPEDIPYAFYDQSHVAANVGIERSEFSTFSRATKAPVIRQVDCTREPKPPVPPKQSLHRADLSPKYGNFSRVSPTGDNYRSRGSPDEKDRLSYSRAELIHSRRSGRKSARFRNRRADIKRLYKTEDSGYLSTDSNESKRRARFMMQIRARAAITEKTPTQPTSLPSGSDTDDLESLCDGRSESGAESVETDSVFFGNFGDSEPGQLYTAMSLNEFMSKACGREIIEQIDSGFVGETNILVSGDSDSEHRSVISIVTGRDGRASSASVRSVALRDDPYAHSVEC